MYGTFNGIHLRKITSSLATLTSSLLAQQQLKTITMPSKDGRVDFWEFYGDKRIGVAVDRGALKLGLSPNDVPISRKRS
jgi:hypothetical protein